MEIFCKHLTVQMFPGPTVNFGFWGTIKRGGISGHTTTRYRCVDCKNELIQAWTAITPEESKFLESRTITMLENK